MDENTITLLFRNSFFVLLVSSNKKTTLKRVAIFSIDQDLSTFSRCHSVNPEQKYGSYYCK